MLSLTTKGLPQSGETLGIFSTAAARSSALPFGTTWMNTGFEAFASIRRYTSSIASVTCPIWANFIAEWTELPSTPPTTTAPRCGTARK